MSGKDKNPTTSRRSVLKSAAATGSSLALVPAFGQATTEDQTRIPIVVSGDDVVVSRKVPRRWWSRIKTVREVKNSLELKLADDSSVADVNIVGSEKRVAGRTVTKVNVEVHPDKPAPQLAESMNGVEVAKTTVSEEYLTSCTNTGSYSSVPGGVAVDDDENGWSLSSFCRVYSNTTDKYLMMSAAHGWGSCDSRPTLGDSVYQDGQYAGAVDSYSVSDDIVLFEDDSSEVSYSNDVLTSDGRRSIDGAAVNYEYMDSNNTTMYKTGVSSGHTTGQIQAIDTSANVDGEPCLDLGGRGIKVSNDQHGGDSGCPVYAKFGDDRVGIVSIATLGGNSYDNQDSPCNGNTAYRYAKGLSSERMSEMTLEFGR